MHSSSSTARALKPPDRNIFHVKIFPRYALLINVFDKRIRNLSFSFTESVQPIISYNATPYPFVTNGINITLTCAGRSVDFVSSPDDQSYITNIELYKNDEHLHNCKEDSSSSLRIRSLSCNVTVTGVVNNDKFMCAIRASFAPFVCFVHAMMAQIF